MATSPIDTSAAIPAWIIELAEPGPMPGTMTMRICRVQATPHRDAWQAIIDRTLAKWDRDSSALEDDGIDPPSTAAIAGARKLALYFRDAGLPAAKRIVSTGDGGVAVEFESNDDFTSFEADADGKIELIHLHNGRIVFRSAVSVPDDRD